MTNEYMKGCPECCMSAGMNSTLLKAEEGLRCATNPMHKYKVGNDGFLKSF